MPKKIILLFILISFTGCIGTLSTRTGADGFGEYPFQAVYVDLVEMPSDMIRHEEYVLLVPAILIATPLDLVIDVILLPADLILWPLGYQKGGALDGWH